MNKKQYYIVRRWESGKYAGADGLFEDRSNAERYAYNKKDGSTYFLYDVESVTLKDQN